MLVCTLQINIKKIWLFHVAMADWEGAYKRGGILLEGQQLLFLKPFDFTDFFNQGVRNVIIIKKGQLTLEASLVHLYFAKDGKM